MEVSYKIKSTIASEEWWEIANAANCATIARAETTDGSFLCAPDNDLAMCMVRAGRERLSVFHVACLLTQCSLSPGNFEREVPVEGLSVLM